MNFLHEPTELISLMKVTSKFLNLNGTALECNYYLSEWNWHLPVQSQQWKHRNIVWNLFKVKRKTPEQRQRRRFAVFIINFEQIPHFILMFLLLTLNKEKTAGNVGARKGRRGFSRWFTYAENVRETLRISEIHSKYTAEKTTFSVNILDVMQGVVLYLPNSWFFYRWQQHWFLSWKQLYLSFFD